MLATFANAKHFTRAGAANPDEMNKKQAAALTALGVLIPGEIVGAATAVSGALSTKSDAADGTAVWAHLDLARILMLVLGLLAIPLLFRYGSGGWWKNGWRGGVLVLLTMVSFAAWLVLQPLSIYQGWFSVDAGTAAAVALVAALVIGGFAGLLGWSQASSPPKGIEA